MHYKIISYFSEFHFVKPNRKLLFLNQSEASTSELVSSLAAFESLTFCNQFGSQESELGKG